MAGKINPKHLEEVLEKAGVSREVAKAILDANEGGVAPSERPRGHGSTSADLKSVSTDL